MIFNYNPKDTQGLCVRILFFYCMKLWSLASIVSSRHCSKMRGQQKELCTRHSAGQGVTVWKGLQRDSLNVTQVFWQEHIFFCCMLWLTNELGTCLHSTQGENAKQNKKPFSPIWRINWIKKILVMFYNTVHPSIFFQLSNISDTGTQPPWCNMQVTT